MPVGSNLFPVPRPPGNSCRIFVCASICGLLGGCASGPLAPGVVRGFHVPTDGLEVGLRAAPGRFVRVVVDQSAVDLAVELRTKHHAVLRTIDGYEFGPEPITFVVPPSGEIRLRIYRRARSADSPAVATVRWTYAPEAAENMTAETAFTLAKEALLRGDAGTDEALADSLRALKAWQAAGNSRDEAGARVRVGELLFRRGNIGGAGEQFRAALAIGRRLHDGWILADTLTNLAVISRVRGDVSNALSESREALALWKALGHRSGEGSSHNNLALEYWQIGQWHDALKQYSQALNLIRGRDPENEAVVLSNMGLIQSSLGDLERANDSFSRAADLLQRRNRPTLLALSLMRRGRAEMLRGDLAAARTSFEESLRLLAQAKNPAIEADLLNNLGQLELAAGRFLQARLRLQAALTIYVQRDDRRGIASIQNHTGVLLAGAGKTDESLKCFRQALELRRKLELPDEEAETWYEMARAERAAGRTGPARHCLDAALAIVERLRTRAFGEYFRASYFSSKEKYFEEYIGLLMDLHRADPKSGWDSRALEIAERAKARALLESLLEVRGEIRRDIEPGLLDHERDARQRLNILAQKVQGRTTGPAAEALRVQFADAVRAYEEVEGDIRKESPRYAALVAPQPLGAPEVQALLEPDTVLLEYFLGEKRSYLWVITREKVRSAILPARAALEDSAGSVIKLVSKYRERRRDGSLQAQLEMAVRTLSQMLLGPVGTLDATRVVIAGDGALHYVPFAVLTPKDSSQPLGFTHEIVQTPSATVLPVLRGRDDSLRGRRGSIAVFADPIFMPDDSRVSPPLFAFLRPSLREPAIHLRRLVFSRREAEAIRSLVPRGQLSLYLDADAAKRNFLSPKTSAAKIIHLATHAHVEDAAPEASWIAFSQVDSSARPQDGMMFSSDIYNLDMHAALVTLSACESGLGRVVKGEGLMGISRAFLYAGAARLLVSLWPVEDVGTATFMRSFYGALIGRGERASAALLSARKSMRDTDPYLWAGFTLIGEVQ